MEMHDCCGAKEYEDPISKLDDVDLLTQEDVQEYAGILSMSVEEMDTQEELQKKFRNRLRSLLKK
jgi:hypothetical protein